MSSVLTPWLPIYPCVHAIVLFHNIFFSSGEQPEQRIAAHKYSNQLPFV